MAKILSQPLIYIAFAGVQNISVQIWNAFKEIAYRFQSFGNIISRNTFPIRNNKSSRQGPHLLLEHGHNSNCAKSTLIKLNKTMYVLLDFLF